MRLEKYVIGIAGVDMTGMLQCSIGEKKFCANRTDIGFSNDSNHCFYEVRGNDFNVIVEEQQQVALGVHSSSVDLFREIELAIEPRKAKFVASNALKRSDGFWWSLSVSNNDKFNIFVR